MALVLMRMKLAILRHSATGDRATRMVTGCTLGLLLAAGTVALAVVAPALLPVALAAWALGWVAGPVLLGGGETLRPEHFAMLGIPPARLAAGLLAATLVGVAPLATLLAFAALVVYGARLGPGPALVALPAAALGLLTVLLLSRLAVSLLGRLLSSRLGAVLAGLGSGTFLALTAQGWWLAVPLGRAGDMTWAPALARALPSGWGVVAVDAAGRGDWTAAGALLAAQGALLAGLLAGWAALLARQVTTPRPSGHGPGAPTAAIGPWGPGRRAAVLTRELRSWSRDPMRIDLLIFSLTYGLVFCLLPATAGWWGLLPWAGVLVVAMAAATSANLYGTDGTALWLTLITPGAQQADVRGRQLAWLLAVAPVATLITLAATALSGEFGAWPWVLALLPAVTGGGAGLVVLLAVTGLVPGTDPHLRGANPISFNDDSGALAGQVVSMLVLVTLTALPASAVVLAGTWLERPVLVWAGVPTGVLTGCLCAWWLGRLAHRRLLARGPELLALMRHGPEPASLQGGAAQPSVPPLPLGQTVVVYACWSLAWLPLFPQGLVPLVFKLAGSPVRSWFLPLYLPPAWQWPVILGMIALGLAMVGTAVAIPRRHARRHRAEPGKGRETLMRRCVALTVGLSLISLGAAPAPAGAQPAAQDSPPGGGGAFSGLVDVGGGRRLYLECRGAGAPTVVLEAGYGNHGAVWDAGALPAGVAGPAVLPGVAAFARVCAYDRPGTALDVDRLSRSDSVPQPRTAQDAVADLHTLLRASGEGGPYVLVGHSLGGALARLYASTHPEQVAGLVLVDSSHEDQEARLGALLTPEEAEALARLQALPPEAAADPTFERFDYEASFAQVRRAAAVRPLRPLPLVVLSRGRPASAELPPDLLRQLPPGLPLDALDRETQALQADLATLVPGARRVVATESGHYVQLDQPELVIAAVREVVGAVRRAPPPAVRGLPRTGAGPSARRTVRAAA